MAKRTQKAGYSFAVQARFTSARWPFVTRKWKSSCNGTRFTFSNKRCKVSSERSLLMHLLRNTLLSADHLDKKFFSSTAYPPNNANLKIRRRAGRLSTKISNPAVCRLLILVNSHPALYFLLEFRVCWEKMFWHEGKFSDLKSLISALAVAWAVHWQGAFRRHFAQLVKERKQECLCTSVSTFLLQVVNGLR